MLRAKRLSDTVYIRRLKKLNLPFQLRTVHQMTGEVALLDSGATKNFLDEDIWRRLKIGHFKLSQLLTVHNVDGTENKKGKIEYYCWLKVCHQGRMAWMHFFLTGLGNDHFILGYPFLFAFNPAVDWRAGQLTRGLVWLETIQFH